MWSVSPQVVGAGARGCLVQGNIGATHRTSKAVEVYKIERCKKIFHSGVTACCSSTVLCYSDDGNEAEYLLCIHVHSMCICFKNCTK